MRGFRDLRQVVALAGASALLALVLPWGPFSLLAGLPIFFLLPGYAIAAATFAHGRIPFAQMLVLSVGLSLVVLALGGLLLNYLPGGIRAGWWALLLFAVVLAACRAAALRRPRRWQPPQRPRLPRANLVQAGLVAGGAVAIVVAIALAFVPMKAADAVGYTELWIKPLEGARAGVEIGVGNAEHEYVPYRLFVRFGDGEPPQGRQFYLEPGERKTVRLLTAEEPRTAKLVEAALFRRDRLDSGAYRRVSTWIGPGSDGG